MALVPQAIEDRLHEAEEAIVHLEEKVALLEEALAPAGFDEEESMMIHEALIREI